MAKGRGSADQVMLTVDTITALKYSTKTQLIKSLTKHIVSDNANRQGDAHQTLVISTALKCRASVLQPMAETNTTLTTWNFNKGRKTSTSHFQH